MPIIKGYWSGNETVSDPINSNNAIWVETGLSAAYANGQIGKCFDIQMGGFGATYRYLRVPYSSVFNTLATDNYHYRFTAKVTSEYGNGTTVVIFNRSSQWSLNYVITAGGVKTVNLNTGGGGSQKYSNLSFTDFITYDIHYNNGRFELYANDILQTPDAYYDNALAITSGDMTFGSSQSPNLYLDEIYFYTGEFESPVIYEKDFSLTVENGLIKDVTMSSGVQAPLQGQLFEHMANTNNPHQTNYSQVGAAPLVHTHSKIVASDGSPDPALSADPAGNITAVAKINTDDTTDSTSGTTGSIQTDGGIGAVKNIVSGAKVQGATGYFGGATHRSEFEVDGTLVFNGDATVINDLQFRVAAGKVPAANAPTFEAFTTNTKEYSFAVDDYIDLGGEEVPHSWLEQSSGELHLHPTTKAANSTGSNRYAKFEVYLAYANRDAVWTETTYTAELTIPDGTAALKLFKLVMGTVDLTGYLLGTHLKVTIKRIAATGGTEYAGNIFVDQCGIHLYDDMCGSHGITTK